MKVPRPINKNLGFAVKLVFRDAGPKPRWVVWRILLRMGGINGFSRQPTERPDEQSMDRGGRFCYGDFNRPVISGLIH